MTFYRPSLAATSSVSSAPKGPLRALQLIETVGSVRPFTIVPVVQTWGTAMTPDDRMAEKIRWAERVRYTILTDDVPASFGPYNAVIRVSERGTEDQQRDYLAHLVFEHKAPL